MDNGLHGRYLEQLEAWNDAREFAAELVRAFYNNGIKLTLQNWQEKADFPSISEVKSILNDVMFLDGHDTINKIAGEVMTWDGWYETPSTTSETTTRRVTA